MQLLPKTARLLARQMRISYSRARLTDPEYNLRLGTVYLAGLIKTWGSVEAALAAYNAGEDRVASWKSGQNFAEAAEFVDTIPFTETREYVQIVLRNAAIYRRLYPTSGSGEAATAPPAAAKKSSRKRHP
jgi:soluble lytic murein transglycosylase